MQIAHTYQIDWLAFALTLALIPFFLSHLLHARQKQLKPMSKWLLFGAWALMFPNIPYLFTKGRYLLGYCGSLSPWDLCGNTWVIGFFFLHACIGIPLMYLSLKHITQFLQSEGLRLSHWTVAVVVLFVSAVTVPIGLYGRFNSWNMFDQGPKIIELTAQHLYKDPTEIGLWFSIYVTVYFLTHALILQANRLDHHKQQRD